MNEAAESTTKEPTGNRVFSNDDEIEEIEEIDSDIVYFLLASMQPVHLDGSPPPAFAWIVPLTKSIYLLLIASEEEQRV